MATVYPAGTSKATLSFAVGVDIARGMISKEYPDPKLRTIDCTPGDGGKGPVSDAKELSQLTITCVTKNKTITITDQSWWSSWNDPVSKEGAIVGTFDIDWDILDKFSLEAAVPKLGKGAKFKEAVLTFPENPSTSPPSQPYYEFTMGDGSAQWVGLDGRVYVPNKS